MNARVTRRAFALLLACAPGCHSEPVTLQLALSERGSLAAWVRSHDELLIVFLDEHPEPALVAPFCALPDVASPTALIYTHVPLAPPADLPDAMRAAPSFAPIGAAAALPAATCVGAQTTRVDAGTARVHALASTNAFGFLFLGLEVDGATLLFAPGDRARDAPAGTTIVGLRAFSDPAQRDPVHATRVEVTLRVAGASAGTTLDACTIGPGQRCVFRVDGNGVRRIAGPLPLAGPVAP